MNKTGINYVDYSSNPIAMRCGFKGCPCRSTCWHLTNADMKAKNPKMSNAKRDAWAGITGPYLDEKELAAPLKVRKPSRIAMQFMGDWMDEQVPESWLVRILNMVRCCPSHQFFTLTKQAHRLSIIPELLKASFPPYNSIPNLWNGVSITDQEDADRMIPELWRIPGKRWISYEPMLGPVDFSAIPAGSVPGYAGLRFSDMIHWIVIGSEAGPKRRHININAFRAVRYQAWAAGVKLWVKQMDIGGKVTGDVNLFPEDLRIREWEKP